MMRTALLSVALLVLAAHSASVQVRDAAKCNLCKAAVTELKVMAEDDDTKALLGLLKTWVCANVPIEDCDNWVTNELAALDSVIEDLDPTVACSSISLCSASTFPLQEPIQCEFCEFLGNEIVKRVLTNSTIDQVVAEAGKVCSELPFVSNECSALVKEYGHYYLELLVGTIDVAQLCSEIGLCSSQVRDMVASSKLFQAIMQGLQDDDGCKACTDGMDIIKNILNSKDTLDLLHIAVHEICGLVSVSGCEILADTALDQILNKVLPMFDPVAICKQVGACPALEIQDLYSPAKVGDDSPVCQGCHDLFGEIKKSASDPATKVISKDLAPVICELVSIPFCESLVSKFLESNLEKAQNLDVDGTCAALGACQGEVSSFEDYCTECTEVADQVLKLLKDPEYQKKLEAFLDELCTVLPIPDCKETLHTYLLMFETLINGMDGKTLCGYLGVCSYKKLELAKKVGDTCSECTMIAGEVITLLENGQVDALIKEAITEVCTILPISDCEKTLDGYFDEIVALLKSLDAKTLCSLIGLCGSSVNQELTYWNF